MTFVPFLNEFLLRFSAFELWWFYKEPVYYRTVHNEKNHLLDCTEVTSLRQGAQGDTCVVCTKRN
jgi:hypothetical protein